nr:hypothetical protein [Tanacetum cinerariifolium]
MRSVAWLEGVSSESTFPVWVGYCQHGPQPDQFELGGASGSGKCGDEEEGADDQDDEEEDGDGDTYTELSLGNGLNVVLCGSHHQGHMDCEFLETLEWTKSTVSGRMEAFMTCGNGTVAGWSVFMSEDLDDD